MNGNGNEDSKCGNPKEMSSFLVEISSGFIDKEVAVFCEVSLYGLRNVFQSFGKKLYNFLGLLRCWKQHAPLNRR